jgi:hypothetical protein
MSALALWCRVVIGGVFLLSLAGKLADLRGFQTALRGLRLLPAGAVAPVAVALVSLEALTALLLLSPSSAVAGFLLAAGLLVAFALGLRSTLRRGVRTTCACFGALSATAVRPADVWRNALLVVVCGAGVWASSLVEGTPTVAMPGRLLVVLSALPALGAVVVFSDIVALYAGRPQGDRAETRP